MTPASIAGEPDRDNVVPLRRSDGDAPWERFDATADRDEFTRLSGHPWFVEDVRGAALRRRGSDSPWVALATAAGLAEIGERLGPGGAGVALQAVAVRLHDSLRSGDRVARVGANKFGLLINAPYADEATAALTRLRQDVRGLVAAHPRWNGLDLRVGFTPLWSQDPEAALAGAEGALERACSPGAPAVVLSTASPPVG